MTSAHCSPKGFSAFQPPQADHFYREGDGLRRIIPCPGDTLRFGEGITPASLTLVREDDDLFFMTENRQYVMVPRWFDGLPLAQIQFADGTLWRPETIATMNIIILGSEHDDILTGGVGRNAIHGGAGNDILHDIEGDNILLGGDGDDLISGRGTIDGGRGNDEIIAAGDAGDNLYLYARGDGSDCLHVMGDGDQYGPRGTLDIEDVDSTQLWLRRDGHHLEITVLGSADGVVVADWYVSAENQLRDIVAGDGKQLTHDRVTALVQAMSAFSAPDPAAAMADPARAQALAQAMSVAWQ